MTPRERFDILGVILFVLVVGAALYGPLVCRLTLNIDLSASEDALHVSLDGGVGDAR